MTDTYGKRIPSTEERADLLRSLSAWTQNMAVAEDLVQQTLIEAWKSDHQPADTEWRPWLFGIARNMFYRWRRDLARDLRSTIAMPESDAILEATASSTDADQLEQLEIVSLLRDMLDDLPEDTRRILLMKYIDELPQAEVAERLGLHEKAVEGRLHRGKRKLRDHIIIHRPDTAVELGLVTDMDTWHTTDIWCLSCGREHLEARWYEDGTIRYDCPRCQNEFFTPGERVNQTTQYFHGGIPSNPPSFSTLHWQIAQQASARLHNSRLCPIRCLYCDRPIEPKRWRPGNPEAHPLPPEVLLDIVYRCEPCQSIAAFSSLPSTGLLTEHGLAFVDRHPQVHMQMPVVTDWQGRPTIRQTWKSRNDPGEFTCWVDTETYVLLDIMIDGELQ